MHNQSDLTDRLTPAAFELGLVGAPAWMWSAVYKAISRLSAASPQQLNSVSADENVRLAERELVSKAVTAKCGTMVHEVFNFPGDSVAVD